MLIKIGGVTGFIWRGYRAAYREGSDTYSLLTDEWQKYNKNNCFMSSEFKRWLNWQRESLYFSANVQHMVTRKKCDIQHHEVQTPLHDNTHTTICRVFPEVPSWNNSFKYLFQICLFISSDTLKCRLSLSSYMFCKISIKSDTKCVIAASFCNVIHVKNTAGSHRWFKLRADVEQFREVQWSLKNYNKGFFFPFVNIYIIYFLDMFFNFWEMTNCDILPTDINFCKSWSWSLCTAPLSSCLDSS